MIFDLFATNDELLPAERRTGSPQRRPAGASLLCGIIDDMAFDP
jgi:hypothetical protein